MREVFTPNKSPLMLFSVHFSFEILALFFFSDLTFFEDEESESKSDLDDSF